MLNYQRVWYAKCQTSSNMPKTKNLPKINDQIKWSWGLDWTQLLIGTLSIKISMDINLGCLGMSCHEMNNWLGGIPKIAGPSITSIDR